MFLRRYMCILCLRGQSTDRTKVEAMMGVGVASRYNTDDVSGSRGGCFRNRSLSCCKWIDECFSSWQECHSHCPGGKHWKTVHQLVHIMYLTQLNKKESVAGVQVQAYVHQYGKKKKFLRYILRWKVLTKHIKMKGVYESEHAWRR